MQTGFRYAFEQGYDIAVQRRRRRPARSGRSSRAMLEPVLAGEADIVVGSRFAGGDRLPLVASRRVGIRMLAWVVSRDRAPAA